MKSFRVTNGSEIMVVSANSMKEAVENWRNTDRRLPNGEMVVLSEYVLPESIEEIKAAD